MEQIELFEMLDELCHNYERTLALLNRLSDSRFQGSLSESLYGEQIYYYLDCIRDGRHTQIPIPPNTKAGADLICKLREKRIAIHGRKVLRANISAIRAALRKVAPFEPEKYAGRFLDQDFLTLPDRVFLPGQLNTSKWIRDTQTGNYESNPYRPENLRFPTRCGRKVRSKSEVFWADALTAAGLLFRCDSAVRLTGGRKIYADFVVLAPSRNRLVYIEHFGRMDDPDYAIKALRRLELYAESGILPGRDLFFTAETNTQPLTAGQIRAVMRRAGLVD